MLGTRPTAPAASEASLGNVGFYHELWSRAHLTRPERFNTWPLISGLLRRDSVRLEVGPGLRPRLPIDGTHFIDLSVPVIERLCARGGLAQQGCASSLPFEDGVFDLVCAFDVIEHAQDDLRSFAELSRVLKDDGILVFSVPLHSRLWCAFDDLVGHLRRYDPAHLTAILKENDLSPEKSAFFGMQPANTRLLACGTWFLIHQRSSALFFYNWLLLPLALLLQKPLQFLPGFPECREAGEVLLVCRRGKRRPPPA